MKKIALFISTICICLLALNLHANDFKRSDYERMLNIGALFSEAEYQYEDLFTNYLDEDGNPMGAGNSLLDEWVYRYYELTNTYLGVNTNNEVYVLNDDLGMLYVGTLSEVMAMLRMKSLDTSTVGTGTFGISDYVWCSPSGIHSFAYHFYGGRYRFTRTAYDGNNNCTDPVVEVQEIHHGNYRTGKTLSNGAVEIDFELASRFNPLSNFDSVINQSYAIFMRDYSPPFGRGF